MTRHARFSLLAILLVVLLSLSAGVLIARAECSGYIVQPDAPWALNGASVVMADGTLDARGAYYSQR